VSRVGVKCLELSVKCLEFRVKCLEFSVRRGHEVEPRVRHLRYGFVFRVSCFVFRVRGLVSRVWGLVCGFMAWGSGFRV